MGEFMLVGYRDQHSISNILKTELRQIEGSKLTKLAAIIDKVKGWTKLLEELTRTQQADFDQSTPLKMTLDAINIIEQQPNCGKSPTLALLKHWSITGRRRPTIQSLLSYLSICKLKWAEAYVWESILGRKPPETNYQAPFLTVERPSPEQSSSGYDICSEFKFDNLEELVRGLESECKRYSFRSIYETTNGFCHEPFESKGKNGSKIGEGRFSSVFRAHTHTISGGDKETVAAKLLKSECNQKYLANEINLISKVHHDNILELLGIALGESSDKGLSYICLIYPYMQNGSLLDCLSLGLPTRNMEFLAWKKRLEIAVKVARGIAHLHSFSEGPIIHRDIKAANILIDIDLQPKLGDFTLVRQLDTVHATQTQFSQNIIGTSVYMPPEAFRGDISILFDTFSFGIVLFELLTGLRPFNEELDEDLFTYINGKLSDIDDEVNESSRTGEAKLTVADLRDQFLREVLDRKAGDWQFEGAKVMFETAILATESHKRDRPKVSDILPRLESTLFLC